MIISEMMAAHTPWVQFSSRWRMRGRKKELEEALLLHPW